GLRLLRRARLRRLLARLLPELARLAGSRFAHLLDLLGTGVDQPVALLAEHLVLAARGRDQTPDQRAGGEGRERQQERLVVAHGVETVARLVHPLAHALAGVAAQLGAALAPLVAALAQVAAHLPGALAGFREALARSALGLGAAPTVLRPGAFVRVALEALVVGVPGTVVAAARRQHPQHAAADQAERHGVVAHSGPDAVHSAHGGLL